MNLPFIDFMGKRKIAGMASITLVILCLGGLGVLGLNLGKLNKQNLFGHSNGGVMPDLIDREGGMVQGELDSFDIDFDPETGESWYDRYADIGFAENMFRVGKNEGLWGMTLGQYADDGDSFEADLRETIDAFKNMSDEEIRRLFGIFGDTPEDPQSDPLAHVGDLSAMLFEQRQ